MNDLHPTVARVTERIVERSKDSRRRYLELMEREGELHADRNVALPCSNLAHGFAAMEEAIPANVLAAALFARYRSRTEQSFADKLLSAMRFGFGGHVEVPQ